jgi:hypothetical protein
MERIWGPIQGFYLAAYAAPARQSGAYSSYTKVCWTRPDSYWEADCAFKVFGGEGHASAEAALAQAALVARTELGKLPPRALKLADDLRRDQVPIPRLLVTLLFQHRAA